MCNGPACRSVYYIMKKNAISLFVVVLEVNNTLIVNLRWLRWWFIKWNQRKWSSGIYIWYGFSQNNVINFWNCSNQSNNKTCANILSKGMILRCLKDLNQFNIDPKRVKSVSLLTLAFQDQLVTQWWLIITE